MCSDVVRLTLVSLSIGDLSCGVKVIAVHLTAERDQGKLILIPCIIIGCVEVVEIYTEEVSESGDRLK